jgi:hypothetical protein
MWRWRACSLAAPAQSLGWQAWRGLYLATFYSLAINSIGCWVVWKKENVAVSLS